MRSGPPQRCIRHGQLDAGRVVDAAGNPDPTPVTRSWTVDATPPQTTIDSGPSGLTNDASPSFTFSSSEGGSSFECRLDSNQAAD